MNHASWYQQRYGNAQAQWLKQKKRRAYEELNRRATERRQRNKESADVVFSECGVLVLKRTKTHWLVSIDGSEYYYCPTTCRFRPKNGLTTYYSRGALDFVGKVQRYQHYRR